MDDTFDTFFIKGRLVTKVINFRSRCLYMTRLSSRFGWSSKLSEIVLQAYCEFIELKVIARDWDSITIIPSWPVHQVWKLMVLETEKYASKCRELCGHMINYHPDETFSIDEKHQLIAQTKNLYSARFDRPMRGGVWSFDFKNHWWDEYDTNLKCSQVGFYLNGGLKKWICSCCSETDNNKPKLRNINWKQKIVKPAVVGNSVNSKDVTNSTTVVADLKKFCILGSNKSTEKLSSSGVPKNKHTEIRFQDVPANRHGEVTGAQDVPTRRESDVTCIPEIASEVVIDCQKDRRSLKRPLDTISEPYHVVLRSSAKKKRLV